MHDKYFWNVFLKLLVEDCDSPIFVAMFSACASAGRSPARIESFITPSLCDERIELTWRGDERFEPIGLNLSQYEAFGVFDKFTEYNQDHPRFLHDLKKYTYAIKDGHTGALRGIIEVRNRDQVGNNLVHASRSFTLA